MINLQFSQKAFEFHFQKVEIIFDNIIKNKIGKNKFNDTTIKFIKRYKNILISGKPNLLLKVHKKYLNIIEINQQEVIKSFFKDNLYPNQFQTKYSKEFLDLIGIDTCFYCNKNYTIKLTKTHARAELDHWFPKEKFPLLVLSFYNLIPSCHSCNHIKGNGDKIIKSIFLNNENATEIEIKNWWNDEALTKLIHPYIKEDSEGFNFDFFYDKDIDNLKIETRCFKKSINTNKTLEFNQIKNIYNSHSEKELRDLVNLRYKYSNNYIKILTEDTFKNLKISKEEIYRMVFGIEIEEENYHRRPFSKFKKDIIDELLRIDNL
jgi:hypothetical protein